MENPPPQPPCRCPDNQLRVSRHGLEQRYISPTTGKCKELVVQSTDPQSANEQPIKHKTARSVRLGIWLAHNLPNSTTFLTWSWQWASYVIALIEPTTSPKYTGMYTPYLRHYMGQLWAARSTTEYSYRVRGRQREYGTHTIYPRTLMILDSTTKEWTLKTDPNIIKRTPYATISFRWNDVFFFWEKDEVKQEKKKRFITDVQETMEKMTPKMYAYWLDFECSGDAEDVYRMADIYRHSEFTLIMLPDNGKALTARWEAYGSRLWTFPEALLSRRLFYKAGYEDVRPLSLHELATFAYTGYEMEASLISTYDVKKDPLERLERLLQLKAAIWRRSSGLTVEELAIANENPDNNRTSSSMPADRVYALMGFFPYRIMPDSNETNMQALARLSIANDSDQLAERMISMLPDTSTDEEGWYADGDHYDAKLWDIEPECQVCGITASGALVLDGCRAASIRWKGFPKMAYATKASLRRSFARFVPRVCWPIFMIGIFITAVGITPGVAAIVIAVILFLVAPFCTSYGHVGKVVLAQPWLIGVKGYISAETASEYLYGVDPKSTDYTPSGSQYAEPRTSSEFRRGNERQRNVRESVRDGVGDLFTLIDTRSRTIYYFRARNPPTVCVYTGREGGLGRMPSYISKSMHAVDWVAVGGVVQM